MKDGLEALSDIFGREIFLINPIDVLQLDLFYALLSIFKLLNIEVAEVVGEVLSLEAAANNLLVRVVHLQVWHVGVIIRPFVTIVAGDDRFGDLKLSFRLTSHRGRVSRSDRFAVFLRWLLLGFFVSEDY